MFKKLSIKDFMGFKEARFTFGKSLNIFIGENASGKTQFLKLLFFLSSILKDISQQKYNCPTRYNDPEEQYLHNRPVIDVLKKTFRIKQLRELIRFTPEHNIGLASSVNSVIMGDSDDVFGYIFTIDKVEPNSDSLYIERIQNINFPYRQNSNIIFLPAREMLSMYQNFRSLNDEYDLPYDKTFVDTISKLGLPYLKNEPEEYKALINSLESSFDGKIFLRDEKFYYQPKSAPYGMDLDISMAAEGWRKLGMILQLIKNGALRKGRVLLWDEPEANLNPQLIRLIAHTILELSQMGIQVFIATHSLFLVNELEILLAKQKIKDGVRFFNLRKGKAPQQGDSFSALKNVLLLDEEMMQSDRYMGEEV